MENTQTIDAKSAEFKQMLKLKLTPLQYTVTQEKGTERPFSNKYYKWKEDGTYSCIACGIDLFKSDTKFDSGSGWPAFYDVIDISRLKFTQDASHVGANILLLISNPNLVRTEVSCARCGSHLGHVFSDGPKPTGKRYCVNSASLDFRGAGDTTNQHQVGTIDTSGELPYALNGNGGGCCAIQSCTALANKAEVNGS